MPQTVLAVWRPIGLRKALIASAPVVYFVTDHFRRWPAALARMRAVDDAWREPTPRRLRRTDPS